MDKIDTLRNNIDKLDKEIMSLLEERFTLTNKIGAIKKESKTVVLDSKREQVIFDKTTEFSHSPQIIEIYKTIMNESKSLQRK